MNIGSILIGCLVAILLISRQLRERPVREDKGYRASAVLAIIGLIEIDDYARSKGVTIPTKAYVVLICSLALGAIFGVLRAKFAHLWRDQGKLVSKGNWVTIVLWVVGIGLHLASDLLFAKIAPHAKNLGSESIFLYIAISLAAQRAILMQRAQVAEERSVQDSKPEFRNNC